MSIGDCITESESHHESLFRSINTVTQVLSQTMGPTMGPTTPELTTGPGPVVGAALIVVAWFC